MSCLCRVWLSWLAGWIRARAPSWHLPCASTWYTTACGPIKWQIDDSILPLGSSFGETSVGIYTGSVNQQTLFFDIGTVSDPTAMLELPSVIVPGEFACLCLFFAWYDYVMLVNTPYWLSHSPSSVCHCLALLHARASPHSPVSYLHLPTWITYSNSQPRTKWRFLVSPRRQLLWFSTHRDLCFLINIDPWLLFCFGFFLNRQLRTIPIGWCCGSRYWVSFTSLFS